MNNDVAKHFHKDIGIMTTIGLVRQTNQDACATFMGKNMADDDWHEVGCFIVADGMGSDIDGKKASRLAVQIIEKMIISHLYLASADSVPSVINDAFQKANRAIIELFPNSGTGSTATVVVKIDDFITIGHVGDSRAYCVGENQIVQLTRDHRLLALLIELGHITDEDENATMPPNHLYRCFGIEEPIEVDIITRPLAPTEKIVLCTDGLTHAVDDTEIMSIVNQHSAPNATHALVQLALERGGRDNITVIVI